MSWLINFLLLIILFSQKNSFEHGLNSFKRDEDKTILQESMLLLITVIMDKLKEVKGIMDLSFECKKILGRSFFVIDNPIHGHAEEELAVYYYTKVFFDSSTNVNDLSSYPSCINEQHNSDFSNSTEKPTDPVYVTIFIDHRKEQLDYFWNYSTVTSYLMGICFVDGCNEDDIGKITKKVLTIIEIISPNETMKYSLLNEKRYKPKTEYLFIKLIPCYIIVIQLFIIIFHNFFIFIFETFRKLCCSKKKRRKIIPVSGDDPELEKINTINTYESLFPPKIQHEKIFKKIFSALFDIENNFDFLFGSQSKNEINKTDSGLSYMNGIKALSMLTMIFGFVFFDLFNSPITKKSLETFYELLSNPFFYICYFGYKYAPKLLICSSGFSLFFKFMCYLDDKSDAEEELKKVQEEETIIENNNKTGDDLQQIKNDDNNEIKEEKINTNNEFDELDSSIEKKNNNISFKYLFLFMASQLNKYFLYLLIILFIVYSLFDVAAVFVDIGPLWNFFREKIIATSLEYKSIIPAIFCFQFNFIYKYDIDSLFAYYFLIYQEVLYFIISCFIIFFGYKYNLRIDRFILGIILVSIIFRYVYFFVNGSFDVRNYFDLTNYGYFYNSTFYNYIYYALGIYFGSLNYVIQKGYTYYECERQNKTYLLGITRLLKMLRNRSKLLFYFLGRAFLLIIIFFSFWQFFLFEYIKKTKNLDSNDRDNYSHILSSYHEDLLPSIILFIDTDIVVILVILSSLFLYLTGDSLINKFLNIKFFNIFNRIHFSFLLIINPIIFYVFYMTESRINFSIHSCYLYSFACGFLTVIFAILIYALFELPYKKVVKLALANFQIKLEGKRLDILDNKTLIYKKEVNNDSDMPDNENNSSDSGNKNPSNDEENLIKI